MIPTLASLTQGQGGTYRGRIPSEANLRRFARLAPLGKGLGKRVAIKKKLFQVEQCGLLNLKKKAGYFSKILRD